jgi:hypothetical protein
MCRKVYYTHCIPSACFGHSCGHFQGAALQRIHTLKYYRSQWNQWTIYIYSALAPWLLVIFGCSPTWICSWKGLVMTHETTLYWTRRPSWAPFAKRHSRNASNNGRTAGRSVFNHKETTSKGIRVADLQVCKCIFPGQRSDTFWTGLVYADWPTDVVHIHICADWPTNVVHINTYCHSGGWIHFT